jgi:D-sedoheptulose 7-phosphate isomerase
MVEDIIKMHFNEASAVLEAFMADDENYLRIATAGDLMAQALEGGGKIISCGNGGSMSDAMHFAEELSGSFAEKRKALAAIAISDPSHITCVANDFGFDEVFSRFLEAIGKKGDVLLAISTSGNSGNIVRAAQVAREMGIYVVALTGKDGGELAQLSDVEIRVPWHEHSDRIQEIHIKIIHSLIAFIEKELGL